MNTHGTAQTFREVHFCCSDDRGPIESGNPIQTQNVSDPNAL